MAKAWETDSGIRLESGAIMGKNDLPVEATVLWE